jgi:hypothetical protein
MMDARNVIEALKQVPETRLRLIDLAWQVFREDGSLNVERAAFFGKELEEATAEAQTYSRATREAVRCLREMGRS